VDNSLNTLADAAADAAETAAAVAPVLGDASATETAVTDASATAVPAAAAPRTPAEPPASFDVFISFATADLAWAERVADALRAAGVTHWLAPARIDVGEDFVREIASALERAKVMILVLSPAAAASPWVRREVTLAVSESRPVLPLKVEAFDVPPEFRMLLIQHQWDDPLTQSAETRVDRVVTRARAELRRITAGEVADAGGDDARRSAEPVKLQGVNPDLSPYVGPRPFPPQMADRFFGREVEAAALLRLVAQARVVLVYAPSGAGKSSLLNTVVCHGLAEQGLEVLLGARVGGALPDGVRAADVRNVYTFAVVYGLDARRSGDAAAAPSVRCRLADCLAARRRWPGTYGRALVLDQFEELFTRHAERFEDRAGFFDDLADALAADPGLRVILSMRQEYLADVEPLAARLPADLAVRRFALTRLGPDGALAAVTRPAAPYAAYAAGVAEEIVRQLNTIRVPGFDGVPVEKRGEFIEMVHLQIVCDRLWRGLPRGVTRIEAAHVERAAGDGRSFGAFVVNALDGFYDDTVRRVAASDETRRRGGYAEALIRLGCMKFVTPAATRTMVRQANGRTGRLPDWVVDQLEQNHLLRSERRGGERWYELSHDRLAAPVGRRMDRQVGALLFAADLLARVLERVLGERGGVLAGYFQDHRDVLRECEPFHAQTGLFADEAEFVFRASLSAGQQAPQWSRRLAADYPAVRLAVLREALGAEAAGPAAPVPSAVRCNAAALLGVDPCPELAPELVRLALADDDEAVRKAAANSLAEVDDPALYSALAARLPDGRATDALSLIRIAADRRGQSPRFEQFYQGVEPAARWRVRRHAWAARLVEGLHVLPYVLVPAILLGAGAAGLTKWGPGMFGWALCQKTPSLLGGLFHGITAGVIWGGVIPLFLTVYRVAFAKATPWPSATRPGGALVAGAVGGFVAGMMIMLIILGVYERTSLASMGWLANDAVPQFSRAFWADVLVHTRYGWVYSVTGTALGLGMAMTANALRASPGYTALLGGTPPPGGAVADAPGRLTGGRGQTRRLIGQVTRLAARAAWPLPALSLAAAVLAFALLQPYPSGLAEKVSVAGRAVGVAADTASQLVGGFFAVVGMGLGSVVMSRGVQLRPRQDQA
jgi:hypothetical protein